MSGQLQSRVVQVHAALDITLNSAACQDSKGPVDGAATGYIGCSGIRVNSVSGASSKIFIKHYSATTIRTIQTAFHFMQHLSSVATSSRRGRSSRSSLQTSSSCSMLSAPSRQDGLCNSTGMPPLGSVVPILI